MAIHTNDRTTFKEIIIRCGRAIMTHNPPIKVINPAHPAHPQLDVTDIRMEELEEESNETYERSEEDNC